MYLFFLRCQHFQKQIHSSPYVTVWQTGKLCHGEGRSQTPPLCSLWSRPWRVSASLQEEALLEISYPLYRKTGGKIRIFMKVIANNLAAAPEISLAGNFHYTVPTHFLGTELVLRKLSLSLKRSFHLNASK